MSRRAFIKRMDGIDMYEIFNSIDIRGDYVTNGNG